MPRLSIITAAYAPSALYIETTASSIGGQELPAGWDLEWVVQEDGDRPSLEALLERLPFMRYAANGIQLGVAMTRNLALSRASGTLIQLLDHDDVLLQGALAKLIRHFDDPSIHWAIGQADDLTPDGARLEFKSALPYGRIQAGSVNDWAIEHGGNWPIHCAALTLRTATVRSLGGWAASPADDDISMFAALSEISDGMNDPELTWLYRQHAQQAHKSIGWRLQSETGRRIALQRVAAIRLSQLAVSDLQQLEGPNIHMHVDPAQKFPGT